MEKSKFIAHHSTASSFKKEEIPTLQNIISQYPYCQNAQILLAKAFKENENLNFERQLHISAAYASNRSRLYSLIESSELTKVDIKEEKVEKTIAKKTIPIVTEEIKKIESDATTIERQVVTAAINSSILLEVSDELPTNLDNFPTKKNKTSSVEKKVTASEVHSFNDWLSIYSDTTVEEENVSKSFYEKEGKPAAEFYSPSKMAKLSIQENEDLVTETLAQIYTKQAHFEKAINAYKKLQLKYPEKKIYFAARISEIENQTNT